MHPPVVFCVLGLVDIRRIVEQRKLIAHVQQRDAAEAVHDRVRAVQSCDGRLEQCAVVGGECTFDTGEARGTTADTAVARRLVDLELRADGEGPGSASGVPLGQEPSVREAVPTDGRRIGVVDGPADVVVAAEVGGPRCRGRLGWESVESVDEQAHVLGGESRPDLHHEAVVVGQVGDVAGVLADTEVVHDILGTDDRLGLEHQ